MSVVPHDVVTVLDQFDVLVKSRVHHKSKVEYVDALNWCPKHARGVAVGIADVSDNSIKYECLSWAQQLKSWDDDCRKGNCGVFDKESLKACFNLFTPNEIV